MRRPGRADRWCERCDPANRALGKIALRGCCAVELVGTDAVGEDVDQIRDVRIRRATERVILSVGERLGENGRQGHNLDAEAWIDALQAISQQPRQTLDLAHRYGGADTDRLHQIVDPVEQEIEAPRAEALRL